MHAIPQFNAMIEACENGDVNLVITKSISRFARNTLDALHYIRKLKALNIPIIFEKESVNTLEASGELMEDGICTPSDGEEWCPSTAVSILENEKYCGDLLMQKWYVEDYLTHECVKNTGDRPQYFVENDHDPIVPQAVFY